MDYLLQDKPIDFIGRKISFEVWDKEKQIGEAKRLVCGRITTGTPCVKYKGKVYNLKSYTTKTCYYTGEGLCDVKRFYIRIKQPLKPSKKEIAEKAARQFVNKYCLREVNCTCAYHAKYECLVEPITDLILDTAKKFNF